MNRKALALEWERRWAVPAAVSAAIGVVLLIVYWILLKELPSGEVDVDFLRAIDSNNTRNLLGSVTEALGLIFLIGPLVYLFRAALARMENMRSQLLGAVIIGPIFVGAAAVVHALSLNAAAADFFSSAIPDQMKAANEAASTAASDQSLQPFAGGLYTAGGLGFAFAMIYICLFCQRSGLLTRLWGTFGMATGVMTLLFGPFPFAVFWFGYIALLISGRLPSGRPPAWEAGEAIPWPTPGERMAADMDPRGKPDYVEGEGSEITPDDGERDRAAEPDEPDDRTLSDPNPTSARELGEIGKKRKRSGR